MATRGPKNLITFVSVIKNIQILIVWGIETGENTIDFFESGFDPAL
jgi:hypothetical protein